MTNITTTSIFRRLVGEGRKDLKMIQIRNRLSDKIIHQGDFENIRECVEDALKNGISLVRADLRFANLSDADLSGANLIGADLSGACLLNTNLSHANLSYANLIGSNLNHANLANTNLGDADLINANLNDACLINANLTNTKMPDKPVILPSIGEAVIGFKKLRYGVVVKVEVPADTQRVSTWASRKCRASALRVIEMMQNPQNIPTDHMPGLYDPGFVYRLGELHHPDQFDPDERDDCLPGLHFFMTLGEAEEW